MQRTVFALHGSLSICLLLSSLHAAAQPPDPAGPPSASASPAAASGDAATAPGPAPAEPPTTLTPSMTGVAAEPAAPSVKEAASAPPRAGSVRLLETDGRQVNLFERKRGTWLSVCTSPCTFPAPEGPRDYAAPTKAPPASNRLRVAADGLWLAGGDGLQAELRDRRIVRKVGAGVVVAGLLTLFLPIIIGVKNDATMAGVTATGAVMTLGGAAMLLMKDRVKLTRCVGCYPAGRPSLPSSTAP